jgi:hypothetical protein
MRPDADPRDPSRDSLVVARAVATDALCVDCIVSRTGLALEEVLEAVGTLETQVGLVRAWGRCRGCGTTGRTLLRVQNSSDVENPPVAKYDASDRHSGLRCGKCWKPVGLGGQSVVLREGQPYHVACLEGPSRVRETPSLAREAPAPVSQVADGAERCTCTHARARHYYEKDRRAWTVCRDCRCVRFTLPATRSGA